jgi:hypothetical protein
MMLARNDAAILQNHHEYLRELHAGHDAEYRAARERLRQRYIEPLKDQKS